MDLSSLSALCPLDGRYAQKLSSLRDIFSEYALIRNRLWVEVAWLKMLNATPEVTEFSRLSAADIKFLDGLVAEFSEAQAAEVKLIEKTVNHDVKALEVWLRQRLQEHRNDAPFVEYIHFACTSEDINNIAHALMLKAARQQVVLPALENICATLEKFVNDWANVPLLARTHGQPASPTTVGKEFANVLWRLRRGINSIAKVSLLAKFNGAVGNYNAHLAAYPDVPWPKLAQTFVESFGLTFNPYTTQIEPHDYMAELFDSVARINIILLDLNRDIWAYIALGYFKQKLRAEEVGSSTMPHKVNPIDFENSEGNLGMANALFRHFSEKLPVSRWQRDLSDSTVLRNLGVAFGYCFLAYQSCAQGLAKLEINEEKLYSELNDKWEVLAEAIQTVMRRYNVAGAYDQLKTLTRGVDGINQESLHAFIDGLAIPAMEKKRLQALTPTSYTGAAGDLATLSKNFK